MGVNNSKSKGNSEYVCNKITATTKMINDDLLLYSNNIELIDIIKINNSYKFIINDKKCNNKLFINLTDLLNDYIKNNFLIFDEDFPIINIEGIEKHIINLM
jgi:hypothetical protein